MSSATHLNDEDVIGISPNVVLGLGHLLEACWHSKHDLAYGLVSPFIPGQQYWKAHNAVI